MEHRSGSSAKRRPFLPALGYPRYRLLWISGLCTWIGRWMETVVGAWLVLELTNSPFQVGLLGTCRFAAMVLGPFCGAVCDRFNRRLILLAVQLVYGSASLAMLTLFFTGRAAVWHLFVFTSLGGLCYTFDYTARYTVAASLVDEPDIISSISLLQVANGLTLIIGPLIGGTLFDIIGATGCFTLISASFLISFLTLLPLEIRGPAASTCRGSILSELASGLRYMVRERSLSTLLLMAVFTNLFIFPYNYSLMPTFARDTLGTGASGFGLLLAAAGVGAIVGSLFTGAMSRSFHRGKLLTGAILGWPLILMALAFSGSFTLSLALQLLAGIAQGTSIAMIQALLLIWSVEEMHGRISGTRAFAMSALSPGNFLTGYAVSLWGAPTALLIDTSAFLLLTWLLLAWAPEVVRRR